MTDHTVVSGGTTGELFFRVGDAETPAGQLLVTAVSSDTALTPCVQIRDVDGTNRGVTVLTAASRTGMATITLTVTDAGRLTATETFTVTVTPAPDNTPPRLTTSPLNPRAVAGAAVTFDVDLADLETSADQLQLTAELVGNSLPTAFVLSGTGGRRQLAVTGPAARGT